eukprot:5429514-Prymnesium_polylepis.1
MGPRTRRDRVFAWRSVRWSDARAAWPTGRSKPKGSRSRCCAAAGRLQRRSARADVDHQTSGFAAAQAARNVGADRGRTHRGPGDRYAVTHPIAVVGVAGRMWRHDDRVPLAAGQLCERVDRVPDDATEVEAAVLRL